MVITGDFISRGLLYLHSVIKYLLQLVVTLNCLGVFFQRNGNVIPNGKIPTENPVQNFTLKEKGKCCTKQPG